MRIKVLEEKMNKIKFLHHESFLFLSGIDFENGFSEHYTDQAQLLTNGFICCQEFTDAESVLLSQKFARRMGFDCKKVPVSLFYDDYTTIYTCAKKEYNAGEHDVNVGVVWAFNSIENKYEALLTYGKRVEGVGVVLLNFAVKESELAFTRFAHLIKERALYNRLSSLTKREADVLYAIKDGKKRSEIADELFMSIHTYDMHRKNIRKKLAVNNYSNLAAYFKYIN